MSTAGRPGRLRQAGHPRGPGGRRRGGDRPGLPVGSADRGGPGGGGGPHPGLRPGPRDDAGRPPGGRSGPQPAPPAGGAAGPGSRRPAREHLLLVRLPGGPRADGLRPRAGRPGGQPARGRPGIPPGEPAAGAAAGCGAQPGEARGRRGAVRGRTRLRPGRRGDGGGAGRHRARRPAGLRRTPGDGHPTDFFDGKGALESFLASVGVRDWTLGEPAATPLHPARSAIGPGGRTRRPGCWESCTRGSPSASTSRAEPRPPSSRCPR